VSAAEELRKAAGTLGELAALAQKDLDTEDYWKPYDPQTAWRDGFVNGFGGVCSDLVAEFTPSVAMMLADLMNASAKFVDIYERLAGGEVPDAEQDMMVRRLLAIAREINGTA
jgi:hypothetical protein